LFPGPLAIIATMRVVPAYAEAIATPWCETSIAPFVQVTTGTRTGLATTVLPTTENESTNCTCGLGTGMRVVGPRRPLANGIPTSIEMLDAPTISS
jgi:hypothetical protein